MTNLQIKMVPNGTTSRVHLKSDNSLYVFETSLPAQVFDDGKETTIPVDLIVLNTELVQKSKIKSDGTGIPTELSYTPILQYSDTLGYVHTTTVNDLPTVIMSSNESHNNFTAEGAKIGTLSTENLLKLTALFEHGKYTNSDLQALSPIYNN